MTPDELAEIGQRVFGYGWQTKLAVHLKVADRTVRRWVAGAAIPGGAVEEIMALGAVMAPPDVDTHIPATEALRPHMEVLTRRAEAVGWTKGEIVDGIRAIADEIAREAE